MTSMFTSDRDSDALEFRWLSCVPVDENNFSDVNHRSSFNLIRSYACTFCTVITNLAEQHSLCGIYRSDEVNFRVNTRFRDA